MACALLLKGLSLAHLLRSDDAIRVYEELVGRYGVLRIRRCAVMWAWAFNNRAFTLKEMGRREQSLAAYHVLNEGLLGWPTSCGLVLADALGECREQPYGPVLTVLCWLARSVRVSAPFDQDGVLSRTPARGRARSSPKPHT